MLLEYPQFLSIGGNVGEVNSFVGIDPEDLTGGVFNAEMLTKGNNLMCYALQLAVQVAPDLISGLLTDVDGALDFLGSTIDNVTDGLGCPVLNYVDKDQFGMFPGYTELSGGGSYY